MFECDERGFLAAGLLADSAEKDYGASRLYERGLSDFSLVSDLLPLLPLPSRLNEVCGAGRGTARLLCNSADTYGAGGSNRANDLVDAAARAPRRVCPAQAIGALDATAVVVCFSDGRDRLSDALSVVLTLPFRVLGSSPRLLLPTLEPCP